MSATLRAMFDGKHFLPETPPSLAVGQIYLLRVEEVDSNLVPAKIAALHQAMQNQAFLDDLKEIGEDFAAPDSED